MYILLAGYAYIKNDLYFRIKREESFAVIIMARWFGHILSGRKKPFWKLLAVNNLFCHIDLIFAMQTIIK
jgi:hypothetical protein